MAEIFPPGSNSVARALVLGVPIGAVALIGALYVVLWSPWMTRVGIPREQPVPFSHKHHVGQLGIDCRYCHTGVEKAAFAGLPPTETCMTCHSQLYTDQELLAPVRQSLTTNRPIRWNRVHDLPDFVYFDHSIHINKGIGCAACHGRVNEMHLTWQTRTLYMSWCLECHRQPEKFIAPRERVFRTDWVPLSDQNEGDRALALVKDYKIKPPAHLTDCYTCHR
jgi:hypothetical protein